MLLFKLSLNNYISNWVVIYDPQFITRQGLESLMYRLGLFREVKVVQSIKELEALLTASVPDLLIADYLPKPSFTPEKLAKMSQQYPELKTLIISDDNNRVRIQSVIKGGISGYLTKSCSESEIIEALHTIEDDGKFFCKKVLDIIVSDEVYSYKKLSEREIEIVKLVSGGYSSAEIANNLIISLHTVNSHRKNILKKLGLKSPTELIIYAAEQGWLRESVVSDP